MTKETMLKLIAEKGYIVSYAAQLNFSTYDIVTSIPQKVTFASLAIAVLGLIWPNINNYWITIPLLLISIACIYTERYAKNIDRYGNRGKENTKQWNDLKILYYKVKDASGEEGFEEDYKKLEEIGNAFKVYSSDTGKEPLFDVVISEQVDDNFVTKKIYNVYFICCLINKNLI